MLRPRIIPFLLVRNGVLVKTMRFTAPRYVGDPLNAVRIYNEKRVDELIICDIDASVKGSLPNYILIEALASECRMPLCYVGGVRSAQQVERIVGLGVEKVGLGSTFITHPEVVREAVTRVGSQSVVVVLDVLRAPGSRTNEVYILNGTHATGKDAASMAANAQSLGAGEIIVNAIDADGMMMGYDTFLIAEVRRRISVPITAVGGAGSYDDLRELFQEFGTIGAAAGSLFVFKGKHKAVLINYPSPKARFEMGLGET